MIRQDSDKPDNVWDLPSLSCPTVLRRCLLTPLPVGWASSCLNTYLVGFTENIADDPPERPRMAGLILGILPRKSTFFRRPDDIPPYVLEPALYAALSCVQFCQCAKYIRVGGILKWSMPNHDELHALLNLVATPLALP